MDQTSRLLCNGIILLTLMVSSAALAEHRVQVHVVENGDVPAAWKYCESRTAPTICVSEDPVDLSPDEAWVKIHWELDPESQAAGWTFPGNGIEVRNTLLRFLPIGTFGTAYEVACILNSGRQTFKYVIRVSGRVPV